jgi:hypothetical protein
MRSPDPRSIKVVPGRNHGSPKEVWGFRSEPGIGPPRRIAKDFLKANAGLLQLDGIAGHLRVQREIESLGAWHVIAQQDHLGLRIHRAYVTVHIGRDRCVYLTKNRAVPRALLPAKAVFRLTATAARRRALRAIRAGKAEIRGLGTERLWFPEKGVLRPAWKLRLHRDRPRAEWIVYDDAEVILHELGHAIQDAICHDFGQSDQAAAMGEGFGDYFAASFFAATSGEHVNGRIWSATLWDVWNAVGRDVADRIVLESHFQLDGFATMAKGARAILDADRRLFRGAHLRKLRNVFAARGIGPV